MQPISNAPIQVQLPPCIACKIYGTDIYPFEMKKKCCEKYKKKGKKACSSCPKR